MTRKTFLLGVWEAGEDVSKPSLHLAAVPDEIEIDKLIEDDSYADKVLFGSESEGFDTQLGYIGCLLLVSLFIFAGTFQLIGDWRARAPLLLIVAIFPACEFYRIFRGNRGESKHKTSLSDIHVIDDSETLLENAPLMDMGTPVGGEDTEYGRAALLLEDDLRSFKEILAATDFSGKREAIEWLKAETRIVVFIA